VLFRSPRMAFIIDIRRQNMLELLLYKALFAMATNRSEFVSLLFSRPAPAGLSERSSASDIFRAYVAGRAERQLFDSNLSRIQEHLAPLSELDKRAVRYIYNVFFTVGPELTYSSVSPAPDGPAYEKLMTLSDRDGRQWSFLSSEGTFSIREGHAGQESDCPDCRGLLRAKGYSYRRAPS